MVNLTASKYLASSGIGGNIKKCHLKKYLYIEMCQNGEESA